jgi:hypothetical protein
MPKKQTSRIATADAIAALIRIYRAAVISKDEKLAQSTAVSLLRYGIKTGDLSVNPVIDSHVGGATC